MLLALVDGVTDALDVEVFVDAQARWPVRDNNDPGDLIDRTIFERLEKAGLIKLKRSSSRLAMWVASPSLLASEKKA